MPASRPRLVLLLAALLLAGGVAAWAYGRPEADAAQAIPGMVRETEIRIAPEISGRLASIAVKPGQSVRTGDLLAVIDNPDLTSALGEANAAASSAAADRARTFSGVRPEQVEIAAAAVRTAEANLLLAQQQNDRAVALNSKSFLSQQQLDQSKASLAKAQADLDGKRAQFAAAQAGPTLEERRMAEARVTLARATVASLEAQLAKTKLFAPADGTIGIRVAEPGEIMAPGKSVLKLDLNGRRWFAFTLREDMLGGLSIGTSATLTGVDGKHIDARVTELRSLGEFATWRAARAVGDHDLNSFRLRLDATDQTTAPLDPGMTVWLDPRQARP